jgi:hypothetical protein
MNAPFSKLLRVTLPAIGISLLAAEGLARFTWDDRQGTPGLVLAHPTRVEVLAPNYDGFFADQPLRINNLGFRDDEDYQLTKGDETFRILVLGDSVTFGHGVRFEDTWPYLLRQRLRLWNGDVDWQVWNLGVPGYDMVLSLRTLEELGPGYDPDLVIVGFYENDLGAWMFDAPSRPAWVLHVQSFFKRHSYLYERLRFGYRALRYVFLDDGAPWHTMQQEWQYLAEPTEKTQGVGDSTVEFKHRRDTAPVPPETDRTFEYDAASLATVTRAVRTFQEHHAENRYPVVFFVNIAPDVDIASGADRFVDGRHNEMNDYFTRLCGQGTPVVSSYDAFWAYRPSEVPGAGFHSLAAANSVKADVLFEYLTPYLIEEPGGRVVVPAAPRPGGAF